MTHNHLTPAQRKTRARIVVSASKKTGDIPPRAIYDLAGVDVPAEATDELQRKHDRKRRISLWHKWC